MQYKIITGVNSDESKMENFMNALAINGWVFKSMAITGGAGYAINYAIIMEKE